MTWSLRSVLQLPVTLNTGTPYFSVKIKKSLGCVLQGYARSDNPLEALRVVDEMQLQGMPLERVSYNSLLLACIRGATWSTPWTSCRR